MWNGAIESKRWRYLQLSLRTPFRMIATPRACSANKVRNMIYDGLSIMAKESNFVAIFTLAFNHRERRHNFTVHNRYAAKCFIDILRHGKRSAYTQNLEFLRKFAPTNISHCTVFSALLSTRANGSSHRTCGLLRRLPIGSYTSA